MIGSRILLAGAIAAPGLYGMSACSNIADDCNATRTCPVIANGGAGESGAGPGGAATQQGGSGTRGGAQSEGGAGTGAAPSGVGGGSGGSALGGSSSISEAGAGGTRPNGEGGAGGMSEPSRGGTTGQGGSSSGNSSGGQLLGGASSGGKSNVGGQGSGGTSSGGKSSSGGAGSGGKSSSGGTGSGGADPCAGVSCGSRGKCMPNGASYRCACDAGFTGGACDLPRFEWIVPNFFTSCGNAISGDGKVVVGRMAEGNRSGGLPFRWTQASGGVALTSPGGPVDSGEASDVSSDGSVVVGVAALGSQSGVFRWTQANGVALIGGSDQALVNANGTTVVGRGPFFRWTAASGLQNLSGFGDVLMVRGLSGDGTTIVGSTNSAGAFRWTGANGLQNVSPAGETDSTATAVSADGGAVVGFYYKGSERAAFRWTRNSGVQDIPLGLKNAAAWSVTADGTAAVGQSDEGGWIWSQSQGVRLVGTILSGFGVNQLDAASQAGHGPHDVSDDGKVITGCAFASEGLKAFIARIGD